MNVCEAGHKKHDTLLVDVNVNGIQLKFEVYEWDKYQGFKGYCTGQDDVSRTIAETGMWDAVDTKTVVEILKEPDEGIVVDFGAHIGWFSIIAATLGRHVTSIEGDPENLKKLKNNALVNKCSDRIVTSLNWIDGSTQATSLVPVQLMKCDLEGNDIHAVTMCGGLLENKLIKYALIEVSPCFNDTYPQLVSTMRGYGYDPYFTSGSLATIKPFDDKWDFEQTNLLFVRRHD